MTTETLRLLMKRLVLARDSDSHTDSKEHTFDVNMWDCKLWTDIDSQLGQLLRSYLPDPPAHNTARGGRNDKTDLMCLGLKVAFYADTLPSL